VKSRVKLK